MTNEFVLISNLLNEKNKEEFRISLGNSIEKSFYKPLFIESSELSTGSLIALDIYPNDCISKIGIIEARKQFIIDIDYISNKFNTKLILLAASTKRLFGKNIELKVNSEGMLDDTGFTLQAKYPDIIFTNGDNGTSVILEMEVESYLTKENIKPENFTYCQSCKGDLSCSGTVIINGLGLLGTNTLLHLIEKQFCDMQVIVISNYTKELDSIIGKKNVQVFTHIKEIKNHCCLESSNKVKLIVNCTHHPTQMITSDSISHIQRGQKIHVIDVAVPYGFPEEEFKKCSNVTRQDGGNAFIENGLEFYFNPEICGLTDNVLYGCFAETVAISRFLKENPDSESIIRELDLFNVNKTAKNFVRGLFEKYGIGIAHVPYNYMKIE